MLHTPLQHSAADEILHVISFGIQAIGPVVPPVPFVETDPPVADFPPVDADPPVDEEPPVDADQPVALTQVV